MEEDDEKQGQIVDEAKHGADEQPDIPLPPQSDRPSPKNDTVPED